MHETLFAACFADELSGEPPAQPDESRSLLDPVNVEPRVEASGHNTELSGAATDVEDPLRAAD